METANAVLTAYLPLIQLGAFFSFWGLAMLTGILFGRLV